jgi:hypothetical protein
MGFEVRPPTGGGRVSPDRRARLGGEGGATPAGLVAMFFVMLFGGLAALQTGLCIYAAHVATAVAEQGAGKRVLAAARWVADWHGWGQSGQMSDEVRVEVVFDVAEIQAVIVR